MKILYGVNSFGNGHITRSRVMAKELKSAGHEVTFLFSGREKCNFFDMEHFGESVIYKKGMQFNITDGKVNLLKTLFNNDISQLLKDIDEIDCSRYDLIITDYEPITAWAARLQNKRSIGIGHQYAFTKKIPISHSNKFMLWVMNHYAPVDIELGLHWNSFGQNILPPIIDVNHFNSDLEIQNKVLIYLPFENLDNIIVKLLKVNSQLDVNSRFVIYHPKKYEIDNCYIDIKPFSKDGFLYDLQTCSGVICNAGFELASEAMHLNKKLLVKPVFGQMEQHSNALAIEQLGYGKATEKLYVETIINWILSETNVNLPTWPNVAKEIVSWLQNIKTPFNYKKIWENNEEAL